MGKTRGWILIKTTATKWLNVKAPFLMRMIHPFQRCIVKVIIYHGLLTIVLARGYSYLIPSGLKNIYEN